MRHGDADYGGSDRDRNLSDLGIAQAQAAGRALMCLGMRPGLICTSELSRAKETGDEIKKYFQDAEMISSEYLSPDSDQRQIVRSLQSWQQGTILLVGHEPHLSGLISLLAAGSRAGRIVISRGAIAVIDFEGGVSYGSGNLRMLLQSGDLRLIGNE